MLLLNWLRFTLDRENNMSDRRFFRIVTNTEVFRVQEDVHDKWGFAYINTDRNGLPLYPDFKSYAKAERWVHNTYDNAHVKEREWRNA